MFGLKSLKFLFVMLAGLLLCLCVLPAVNECEAANAAAVQSDEAAIDTCFLRNLHPLQWLGKRRPLRGLRSCGLSDEILRSDSAATRGWNPEFKLTAGDLERLRLERESR